MVWEQLHLLQLPFSLCQIALINAAVCCCSNKQNAALPLERVFQDLSLRAAVRGSRFVPVPRSCSGCGLKPRRAPRSRSGGPGPSSAPPGAAPSPPEQEGGRGAAEGRGGAAARSIPGEAFGGRGPPAQPGAAVGARGGRAVGAAGQGRARLPRREGLRAPGGSDPASSASSLPGRPFPALGNCGLSACPAERLP